MAFVVKAQPGRKPSIASRLPASLFGTFSANGGPVVDTSAKTHRKPVDNSPIPHESALARPKEAALEHEGYRRIVAAFNCINCGRVRRSQAAHVPPDGKGIKRDDRLTFPLCTDGPGQKVGCHTLYDQYKLFPRPQAVKQGMKWAKTVRSWIREAGDWPNKLPHWPGEGPKPAKAPWKPPFGGSVAAAKKLAGKLATAKPAKKAAKK